jgi:hypothetical protein
VHVQDAEKLAKVSLEPVLLAGSTGFSPLRLGGAALPSAARGV